jgi:hypothetical protein
MKERNEGKVRLFICYQYSADEDTDYASRIKIDTSSFARLYEDSILSRALEREKQRLRYEAHIAMD